MLSALFTSIRSVPAFSQPYPASYVIHHLHLDIPSTQPLMIALTCFGCIHAHLHGFPTSQAVLLLLQVVISTHVMHQCVINLPFMLWLVCLLLPLHPNLSTKPSISCIAPLLPACRGLWALQTAWRAVATAATQLGQGRGWPTKTVALPSTMLPPTKATSCRYKGVVVREVLSVSVHSKAEYHCADGVESLLVKSRHEKGWEQQVELLCISHSG
jgi:hypothetical protein